MLKLPASMSHFQHCHSGTWLPQVLVVHKCLCSCSAPWYTLMNPSYQRGHMPRYNADFKLCLDESLVLLQSGAVMLPIRTDKACTEKVLMVLSVSPDAECKYPCTLQRNIRHGPVSALIFDCHAYPVMTCEYIGYRLSAS